METKGKKGERAPKHGHALRIQRVAWYIDESILLKQPDYLSIVVDLGTRLYTVRCTCRSVIDIFLLERIIKLGSQVWLALHTKLGVVEYSMSSFSRLPATDRFSIKAPADFDNTIDYLYGVPSPRHTW